MTHSGIDTTLECIVADCLREEWPSGQFLSVILADEYESGGDRILVFTVEFEGEVADFVADAPLSLSRVVADRLRNMDVSGFPFLDFVPTAELRAC